MVATVGFNDKVWLDQQGHPQTEKLHMIERYKRVNNDTLELDFTVDDPGAYTKTWTSGWNLKWIPNEELPVYYCQDNRP